MMTNEESLTLALLKVEEISNLIADNECEHYFSIHLLNIKYELLRQISNCHNNLT
jgi:hypothetical protein